MAIVNLLCAYPAINDLGYFSQRVEQALAGLAFEERESSNYAEGRYFTGIYRKIRMVIALSDDVDHNDLTYWIALSSNEMDQDALAAFADALVKEKLLSKGSKVARFVNFGHVVDERRIDY